jgi:hypothetical protein
MTGTVCKHSNTQTLKHSNQKEGRAFSSHCCTPFWEDPLRIMPVCPQPAHRSRDPYVASSVQPRTPCHLCPFLTVGCSPPHRSVAAATFKCCVRCSDGTSSVRVSMPPPAHRAVVAPQGKNKRCTACRVLDPIQDYYARWFWEDPLRIMPVCPIHRT